MVHRQDQAFIIKHIPAFNFHTEQINAQDIEIIICLISQSIHYVVCTH